MPLDEDEWSAASPAKSDKEIIHDFLREHPSEAYSAREIMQEVFEPDNESPAGKIAQAVLLRYVLALLEFMMAEGKVEERIVTREEESGEERVISYYRIADSHE